MAFDVTSPWGTFKPRGLVAFCLGTINRLPTGGFFRRIAFLLRKPVKKGKQAVYDREIWGLKLRLTARGNLSEQRWLTMPQFHDAPERAALKASLSPGAVFLDVGANAGFYTFWALAQRHAGLRVIAVEPTETMLERVRYNLALNQLESAVTLCPCAVTPVPCEVVIEEHADNLGQSAVRAGGTGRRVPGKPLFDLLREAGATRIDAMKIDIEGHEVPVLEAFFRDAPRSLWPRLVIGEIVGDGGGALRTLLTKHGYRVETATKMNGILRLSDV